MRRGEALGLRWSDINWERKTAHIAQTIVPDRREGKKSALDNLPLELSRVVIQPRTKTRAGARTVRLTPDTLAALKAHRTRQNAVQLAAETWYPHDLIICTAQGTPVEPPVVTRCFEHLRVKAGLPRIRVHDLRHTHATLLLLAGQPAKVVSERLGHASISITLDVYSHVLPEMQGDAAEAMSNLLKMSKSG
jgi:integrase